MDGDRFIVLVPMRDLPRAGVGEALRARADELRERQRRGEASPDEARALHAIDQVLGTAGSPAPGGPSAGGGPGKGGENANGAPRTAGPSADPPLLLRVEDVARLLGVSKPHAYNLVSRGDIASVRIGRSLRVRRDVLLAWLDEVSDTTRGRTGRR